LRKVLLTFAFVAGAAALPACHSGGGGSGVSTTDPTQAFYRSPTADLEATPTLKIHFVSVTTDNHEGVDLVHTVFLDSLKQKLGGRFKTIGEGETAAAGEALLDVDITVNWGSRAARAFWGMGAGKAGILMKYNLKDSAGALMAKLDAHDSMSGGWGGGDARALIFAAADKWNAFFATTILAPPHAAPAK
jgi:hypothetical protein